jgi:dTDP-4-amino-4,6-dideoxygalactose transaminase
MPIVLKDSTVDNRDRVREALHAKGIQTSVHYPAVHRFSIYNKYKTILPKTNYVTDNEITLPMYSKLTESDVQYIAETLNSSI